VNESPSEASMEGDVDAGVVEDKPAEDAE